jgi:prepilin-type N-terminal cleavage/methylation domain-containing protein
VKKSTEVRPAQHLHRHPRGFTLLEVLAAVAILGIWFAVLANVAIQGLRSEGLNERRIRASLIADRVLTDIELGLDDGEFPGETTDVQEEDEFTIAVEQIPFSDLEISVDEELMSLLESASLAADLYTIEIRVSWIEGASEQSLHRTTYGWDNATLVEALDQSVDDPEAEEGEDDGDGNDSGEDEPLHRDAQ